MNGFVKTVSGFAVAAIFLGFSTDSSAQIYADLEGIPGDSIVAPFEGLTEVSSLNIDAAENAKAKGGCAAIFPLQFTKPADAGSSFLQASLLTGAAFGQAEFTTSRVTDIGTHEVESTISLTNARVLAFSVTSEGFSNTESIELGFDSYQYTHFGADGEVTQVNSGDCGSTPRET